MPTTIKLKNGSGAPTAGDLVQGEPALDLTNKRLYTEDSGGSVIEVGTNPSSLAIAGTDVTATAAELNILDGVTVTTAELNILDGVTATTAELNILDGVTSTATELNLLDGVTGTILTNGDIGSTVQAYDADIVAKDTNNTFTAAQRGSTDTDTTNTGSVTLDFDTNQNFVLTLTGNVTLANPTTETVGQSGFIVFIQDGTGGRTVSLGTDYETAGGAGLTLSSAASATDVVPYIVAASGRILLGTPQLAFS